MHPLLRRILLYGGLTAAVLAAVGVLFARLAGEWLAGSAPPAGGSHALRVPLTLAGWGFGFVVVWEIIAWTVRGGAKPAPPAAPPADETEKLLNELLAQAEAKMAREAAEGGGPKSEGRGPADKPTGPSA